MERVDLSYHESLQRIVKGDVDAVIWNVVAENELTMLGLEATPLTDDPRFLQETNSSWSVKGDTLFIKEILCLLEDSLSFGRLFDIDVIRTDETQSFPYRTWLSRQKMPFMQQRCLCMQPFPYPHSKRTVR